MDQEDLTASVWDSVLRPAHSSAYEDLSANPFKSDTDSADDDPDNGNDHSHNAAPFNDASRTDTRDDDEVSENTPSYNPHDFGRFLDATTPTSPGRTVHRSQHELFSHLTQDPIAADDGFSAGDTDIANTDALFSVSDGKFPASADLDDPLALSMPVPAAFRSSPRHKQRPRKYTSNVVVHHLTGLTGSEPLDTVNPLAPPPPSADLDSLSLSGDNSETVNFSAQADAPLYNIDKHDRSPTTQAHPPQTSTSQAPSSPSLPFSLDISVGDPVKVGDITSAHIEYSIRTIIRRKDPENNAGFLALEPEHSVTRRYRDFRWLYHQLRATHPGRIVPPPPAKQSYVGRFNEASIENRRLLLERMLARITAHPHLATSDDFVIFLTSTDFAAALRERETLAGLDSSKVAVDEPAEDALQDSLNPATTTTNTGAGNILTSFFSISSKPQEPDPFFTEKLQYIDALELNLRLFAHALDVLGTQRHALLATLEDMCISCREIAALEVLRGSSDLYDALASLQAKIRDNVDRINMQEQMTLAITIEEYLRIIVLIRLVLDDRSKILAQYHSFQTEFDKKQAQLDKLLKKSTSQPDRVAAAKFEVDRLKITVATYEKQFSHISDVIRQELAAFDLERVDDFRNSVEIFIESSIEAQKEAIELYETFYEHQNLAAV